MVLFDKGHRIFKVMRFEVGAGAELSTDSRRGRDGSRARRGELSVFKSAGRRGIAACDRAER